MKILLMGDASSYHATLATGLRRLGHEVTVASDGGRWMDTGRDLSLARADGKLGGALLYGRLLTTLAPRLKGYDIVQLRGPGFVDLRPERIDKVFDRLKRNNGAVFVDALENDYRYVEMCTRQGSPLRYSEWAIEGKPTPYAEAHPEIVEAWLSDPLRSHCEYIYRESRGVVSALYEYHIAAAERGDVPVAYGGIPIDCHSVKYQDPDLRPSSPVRILAAFHSGREEEKGIIHIIEAAFRLMHDMPGRVEVDVVQNVPYNEFLRRLRYAHIVLDQLYSYTPATSALLAMAMGKVTVSGGEEEYYQFIDEPRMRPIVNASPLSVDSIYSDLKRLVENPYELIGRSQQGRLFVQKHNNVDVVARRFIKFWEEHA